jgi:hypothetical protein
MVAKKLVGREPDVIVDAFDLGPAIFEFNNQVIAKSIETVLESDSAVFASPTFKGSYSGIHKAYLDQIPSDGLRNILCLPVMLGASLHHAMDPDLFSSRFWLNWAHSVRQQESISLTRRLRMIRGWTFGSIASRHRSASAEPNPRAGARAYKQSIQVRSTL